MEVADELDGAFGHGRAFVAGGPRGSVAVVTETEMHHVESLGQLRTVLARRTPQILVGHRHQSHDARQDGELVRVPVVVAVRSDPFVDLPDGDGLPRDVLVEQGPDHR